MLSRYPNKKCVSYWAPTIYPSTGNYTHRKMNKISKIATELLRLMALSCLLLSCSDHDEVQELTFVGDSHVERWDLPNSFPSYLCHNYGLSGSGIDYLSTLTAETKGKDVVVVTGRNDIRTLKEEDAQTYAERYVHTLSALSARKLFVYCIFPCTTEQAGGKGGDAEKVELLNVLIKREIDKQNLQAIYIDVYDDLLYQRELNRQYSADGLHLNAYGYQVLSFKLLEAL